MALGVNSMSWLSIAFSDILSRHKNDKKNTCAILQNGKVTVISSSPAEKNILDIYSFEKNRM